MQLYLIRHAESENNAKPVYERVEDPAMSLEPGSYLIQVGKKWVAQVRIRAKS